ncbi:MFS transporter [Mangrovimicrobium sediminis]|uniref:MFS transporter n=1 Tax=Mangrovimicrobium sediminis TaxID=2562682 RepID=A0A4Z0M8R1_9GAMM|nr:MFS transporter [Haliea sp. SAOS-164]TGD75790.1 MFS transporter [Haliea sp. SAOS-164]
MPILFGVVLLDLVGFGIVIPILPFLSPPLGADKLDIALIVAIYAAAAGVSGIFWGRLSDRIGRKPVILLCLCGSVIAYIFLAMATSLWMVYAARAFAGLMAGNLGVASAMMADITRPADRARGMALIGAAFGLGMILGPTIGGLLAHGSGNFTLPCLFAGGMSALAALAAAIWLPESHGAARRAEHRVRRQREGRLSTGQMLRRSGNRLFVFQYLLHNACVSSGTYIFPLWVADLLGWSAREVGMVFGVQGALMVVLQAGAMGTLVRVLGEWRLLRVTVSVFLCGFGLAVVAGGHAAAMVAALFLAMSGATLCIPLLNSIITQRSPQTDRGRVLGATSAASSFGRVVGPALSGLGLGLCGYAWTWALWAAVAALYLAWVLRESARAASMRPAGPDQGRTGRA